ncbi:hypothetical protein EAH89_09765 [Roseomonas nepalensis]|uniref:Uncharacterized protein n=1 Tax=Muricoccus nepalensis TaxID=1854500 RepID=A0A502G8Q5_9PROT|nr:hypothetical protein [Roseomonas nepalensis]TPG57710.1 hypothetical protein EAH89_09765 [Roseomonas nepalensis]
MDHPREKSVFKTLDDIAAALNPAALNTEAQTLSAVPTAEWVSPRREWNGARPANEDSWASQVARYLQQRSPAGAFASGPLPRAAGRGE